MSKQWLFVGIIVAGLGLGAVALTKLKPDTGRIEVGARAPDFRTVDMATGDSVSLRDRYKGHVTLVNVWATWCTPCRAEMPSMQEAYAALKPHGFRIAAVSIDEGSPDDVRRFVREMGLTFDIFHDRSTRIQQVYQMTGVPESFLLDKDGVIIRRQIGAHDWNSQVNRRLIEELMGVARSDGDTTSSAERTPGA